MGDLIKQHADYKLLKNRHQIATNGVIYESDYFTTMRGDGFMGEEMDIYTDSNFKFSVNTTPNDKRVHRSGGWVKNEFDDGSETWKLSTVDSEATTPETKIEMKPDYSSLRDFTYYGSALELVKASMNDIILKFPAGIYFSGVTDANKFWVSSDAYNYERTGGRTVAGTSKSEIRMTRTGEILPGAGDEHDYSQDYFTITSRADNNEIRWACVFQAGKAIQVKRPGETQWIPKFSTQNGTTLTILNSGESLYVWAEDDRWREDSFAGFDDNDFYYTYFKSDKPIDISGNIMSLISYDFANSYTLTEDYTFARLFDDCKVVNAEHLVLPATALTNYCYYGLFSGCTVMTTPPSILPADTLSNSCYRLMFNQCISLTSSPILPATNLADSCYYQMFFNCNSLINAPVLPARALSNSCYQFMFINCSSLNEPPELPADTLADYCYYGMFSHCTDLATTPSLSVTALTSHCYASMFFGCTKLTVAPDLPATQLPNSCYRDMFHDCTSLSSITCSATTFADDSTRSWVDGVSGSGVFYTYNRDSESVWNTIGRGINGIPEDWCVDTYPCDDPELHIVGDSSITICYSDNTPKTINVESNTGWTASCLSNKVVFTSPTISSGNGSVTFYVSEQLASQTDITFTYGDTANTRFENFIINQVEEPSFSISETNFSYTGGSMTLYITCSPESTWVFNGDRYAANKSGTGPATISTEVYPNISTYDETFIVSITITDPTVTSGQCVFTATSACTIGKLALLSASPSLIDLCYDDNGEEHSFNVYSNSEWNVYTNVQGVNFTSPTSGAGDSSITFTVDQNIHQNFMIYLGLLDGTATKEVTIRKPSTPTITVGQTTFQSNGGNFGMEINCTGGSGTFTYSVNGDSRYLSPSVRSGTVNRGSISIQPMQVLANESYDDDIHFDITVNVTAGTDTGCTWEYPIHITVQRKSPDPYANPVPNEISLCDGESTGSFGIESNSAWTIGTSNTITFSQTSGEGNVNGITFTLSNNFSSPTNVPIMVEGQQMGTLKIIRKTTPNCNMSTTAFASEGGNSTFIINAAPAGASYRISSDRMSQDITGTVGSNGTATETVIIQGNTETGVIDFTVNLSMTSDTCTWTDDVECTIAGIAKSLTVTPEAYDICFTDNTHKALDIQSNTSWIVSSSRPEKISFSETSGNLDKQITFWLTGNLDRKETITIRTGDGPDDVEEQVEVRQFLDPSSPAAITYSQTSFTHNGGIMEVIVTAGAGSRIRVSSNPSSMIAGPMEATVPDDASSAKVNLTINSNDSYDEKQFDIIVETNTGTSCSWSNQSSPIRCKIEGKPAEPYLVVCGDTAYTFCYNNYQEKSFQVMANTTWTVTADPTKMYISPTGNVTGNRVVTFRPINTFNDDTITVRRLDNGSRTVIEIKQTKQPSFTITPTNFSENGGSLTIKITGDTSTHWSLSGWYSANGSGSRNITVTVPANSGNAPITNTITFTDTDCNWSTSKYFTVDAKTTSDGKYMFEVYNPFGIDILSKNVNGDVYNPLRYLALSSGDYVARVSGEDTAISWSPTEYNLPCPKDVYQDGVFMGCATLNGVKVYVFYQSGSYHYLTENRAYNNLQYIRPTDDIIEREFDRLDDFEKILLDRSSNPIYTAHFDTPYEVDYDNKYRNEPYTWPSVGDYLPEINTPSYYSYVGKLINLATFYDDYWSDNIWRSMTHESIKNLDWTFIRNEDGNVEDLSQIDSSKVEMITRLWGRNSDDIKRYIDNIKNTAKVSYDQKGNIPDYYLSDEVEISGIDPMALGLSTGSEAYRINSETYRRLRLNRRYLNSAKGTRESIEAMLAMLGLTVCDPSSDTCDGDCEINEYITVAKNFPNADSVVKYNAMRDSMVNKQASSIETTDLEGLPVVRIGSANKPDYVVPWYDVNETYDNGIYFQMMGGWGHRKVKDVDFEGFQVRIKSVFGKFGIYDETVQTLKYAYDMTELLEIPIAGLKPNNMCYIYSIESRFDPSTGGTEDDINRILEHYYVWKMNSDSVYSWQNVLDDPNGTDVDRAIYLSTIIETTVGNNQHCGYGEYDNGEEYLRRLNSVFGYLCDDFVGNNPQSWPGASSIGFNIDIYTSDTSDTIGYVDNNKSWYFTNSEFVGHERMTASQGDGLLKVSSSDTKYQLYSNELGDIDYLEESNSFSLVNIKNMEIKFYYPKMEITDSGDTFWTEYKNYVNNVVMHYVKQMIPSTTILKYGFYSRNGATNQPENDDYGKVRNDISIQVTRNN